MTQGIDIFIMKSNGPCTEPCGTLVMAVRLLWCSTIYNTFGISVWQVTLYKGNSNYVDGDLIDAIWQATSGRPRVNACPAPSICGIYRPYAVRLGFTLCAFRLISSSAETAPPFAVYTLQSHINVVYYVHTANKTRTIVNFDPVGRRLGRFSPNFPTTTQWTVHLSKKSNAIVILVAMFMSCDLKWRNHLMYIISSRA